MPTLPGWRKIDVRRATQAEELFSCTFLKIIFEDLEPLSCFYRFDILQNTIITWGGG
jgi:hypothetical protein